MYSRIFQIKGAVFLGLLLLGSVLLFVDCFGSCKIVQVQSVEVKTNDLINEKLAVISQMPLVGNGLPAQIMIPSINVDTNILHLGLTALGAMDAPKGPDEVSWYNLGVKPGDIGSAVIAGHYGWKDGLPAVFDNLNKLQVGDEIHIQDDEDKSITFIVTEVSVFGQYEDATRVFVSNDNRSHLNLITCGGTYNALTKSYSDRLVVFADKK